MLVVWQRTQTKYFATSNYKKFTKEILDAKIKEKDHLISLIFLMS